MPPQVMITDSPSPHVWRLATTLACATLLFLAAARIATQTRIIPPQRSANSNLNARPKVTTLRASDSSEGSRVAVTADQSLNEYEAYRRGDRFYVKIPPADVPRAEAVRGRAFSDVKVQREGDSTIVSFRLQPGATARVEPYGNKLDVVFTMPGATSSSPTASRAIARRETGPVPPASARKRPFERNVNSSTAPSSNTSRNPNDRVLSTATKPVPTPKPSPTPKTLPSALPTSTAFAQTAATPKISPAAQQRNTVSPASGNPNQVAAETNIWNSLKQRVRYWILLAQLNPIPVAIGAAVLLFLIGVLIVQRRRARATRRARLRNPSKRVSPVPPATSAPVSTAHTVKRAVVAAPAARVVEADTATRSAPAGEPSASIRRPERSEHVSDQLKKLMAGGDYDESVLASDDPETRQLIGAELLSALVGRNLQRRERARAAFMKHGYFDDATRDLRIADSPNERAAAARRLSFVHDREATPHLVAALDDASPDVRRAAVEALMDLRDPAAIASLNSLMQTENDRRVPRSLIKHAIESCAISRTDESTPAPSVSPVPATTSSPVSAALETEREVIEI